MFSSITSRFIKRSFGSFVIGETAEKLARKALNSNISKTCEAYLQEAPKLKVNDTLQQIAAEMKVKVNSLGQDYVQIAFKEGKKANKIKLAPRAQGVSVSQYLAAALDRAKRSIQVNDSSFISSRGSRIVKNPKLTQFEEAIKNGAIENLEGNLGNGVHIKFKRNWLGHKEAVVSIPAQNGKYIRHTLEKGKGNAETVEHFVQRVMDYANFAFEKSLPPGVHSARQIQGIVQARQEALGDQALRRITQAEI
jgi:hypothetical protein